MKKIISLILTFALLLCVFTIAPFSALAANTADFSIKIQKYVNGSYVNDVNVQSGDTLTLFVSVGSEVKNVSGLSMNVYFDASKLEYKDKSFISYIQDKDADSGVSVKTEDNKTSLYIMFDTTSKNTSLIGNVFSFVFNVKGDAQPGKAEFSAEITELFDSSAKAEDIPYTMGSGVSATVVQIVIPEETIEIFKKVINVVYAPGTDKDSAEDIVAATQALASLDAKQVSLLKSKYPELFDAVNNASYRYSLLQQNAAVETVKKEVETFLSTYADVFSLKEEKVTLANKDRITAANTALEKVVSAAAKSRIPQEKKTLLKALVAKIAELEEKAEAMVEAKKEAEEFRNNYKTLLNIDEQTIKTNYSDVALMVEEAELMLSFMSDEAKELLAKEIEFIEKLKPQIQAALEADEKAKEVTEKASEFMKKWKYVFTLTDMSVTAGDESIVTVFLGEYEGLEKDVQEALKARVKKIYDLVEVIESLKDIDEDGSDSENGGENTVVKETITETVTNTIEKNVNLLILWLIVILGTLILVTAIPAGILLYMNKKEKQFDMIGGEGIDE